MGRRRSRPKAFGVILTPGGACLRLYSARSTRPTTLCTRSGSAPSATSSSGEPSCSTYASSTGSSTSYGGRVSLSFCPGRRSADGGFVMTRSGLTAGVVDALGRAEGRRHSHRSHGGGTERVGGQDRRQG